MPRAFAVSEVPLIVITVIICETMNKSKSKVLKELEGIPGVGKSIARDFWDLGLRSAEELKKQSPEALYERLCAMRGKRIDRCMLYVLRCAHYYASKKKHEKRLLKWWNWKEKK